MKAKYLFQSLFVVASLLLGTACSNEQLEPKKDAPSGDPYEMTVFFPGRTLVQPSTYAGTYAADPVEKSIDNVRIYVFDDNNDQPGKLLGTESVRLVQPVGDTETGVTGKFHMRYTGKLHLVPTANLAFSTDDIEKLKGLDFATFSQTMVTQPAGKANAFPMAGEPVAADIPAPTGGTTQPVLPSLNFILERLSARIDIENLTTADAGGEYTILGARMEGDIDRSYLIKGQDPALQIGQKGAAALNANAWIDNNGVNGDMKKMYMQLYTYENVENAFTLHLKGMFNGGELHTQVTFNKPIKRNTRYVVKVRNEATNKVAFDVEVVDWNEGGNASVIPGVDGTQPTITAIDAVQNNGTATTPAHTLVYGTNGQVNTVNEIRLNSPNLYYTKITVESPSMESMILVNKVETPWVRVSPLGESRINGGKLTQDFLVTYAANADLYERTAELEIQNKYLPNKQTPRVITITQPAATATSNPLAYFANANVDELNTFSSAMNMSNYSNAQVWGKIYQKGRNVVIEGNLVLNPNITDPNDPRIWDKAPFNCTHAPYNWRNFDSENVWKEIVKKSTKAPLSYKGNNDGDPSPLEWHVPGINELFAIVPSVHTTDARDKFTGRVNFRDVHEENIMIKGISGNYTADYLSTERNVYYALKMKGTEHMTAIRFEKLSYNVVRVTARHLGASVSVTIDEVATSNYWRNNAGSDVVRYFPYAVLAAEMNSAVRFMSQGGYSWGSDNEVAYIRPIRNH